MVRAILGTIAGVVAGTGVILLIEILGHHVYPFPPGVNPKDPESLKAYMAAAPVGASLFVLAAYAFGSFAGGAAGAAVGGRRWAGVATGGVLLILGVVVLLMYPHPVWFCAASLSLYLPAAWLGARLVRRGGTPPS